MFRVRNFHAFLFTPNFSFVIIFVRVNFAWDKRLWAKLSIKFVTDRYSIVGIYMYTYSRQLSVFSSIKTALHSTREPLTQYWYLNTNLLWDFTRRILCPNYTEAYCSGINFKGIISFASYFLGIHKWNSKIFFPQRFPFEK